MIDLTRLVSRQDNVVLTGIDRVELAWLDHLLAQPEPLFALVRTAIGYLLLDRTGAQTVARMAHGRVPPVQPDLISRLTRRSQPQRGRAETILRRLALARAGRLRLGGVLRRHLPRGSVYLNLGHANLTRTVMRAVASVAGAQSVVLVHDTIPLDYPRLVRKESRQAFRKKLRVVARRADLVIHIAETTRQRTEKHLSRMGRVPPGIVAPLGVTVAPPDGSTLVDWVDLSRPYYLALGTIEPRKDPGLLLEVWRNLPRDDQGPLLVFVGNRGWLSNAMHRRMDRPPHGVIEVQGLPDPAVSALLAGAKALLFPSRAEGFGLPPLEAAALGVRVICSDLPVLRETLGDYPVYLPSHDPYAWRKTIEEDWLAPPFDPSQASPVVLPRWEDHFARALNAVE
ncbi:MAG: glycosyltransferase family 1 protein [Rhodobacteraceae bacterium]|nr:glycosyltransferase family 1 protein [Paracoccaceae bacterium]